MNVTTVGVSGRKVLVARPNGLQYGHLGLEMQMTLAQAKAERAAVCFLPPPVIANDALFALTTDDVQILHPSGPQLTWFRFRWQLKDAVLAGAAHLQDTSNSFWLELYRELRRHSADERFPVRFRQGLRRLSHRAIGDETAPDAGSEPLYYRRRLIRDRLATHLPPDLAEGARETAAAIGIEPGVPVVSIHAREAGYKLGREQQDRKPGKRDDSCRNARIETYFDAVDHLVGQGYTVVRLGDASMTPVRRKGIIDLATSPRRTPALEVFLLLMSEFIVCSDSGLHAVSDLTNTPRLTVNVTEPINTYPVRPDGLYMLKKVIDLDTGRTLTLRELLSEAYFRQLRNPARYGYRDNTTEEIAEAVKEMQAGLRHGWHESDSQTRYRQLVVEGGMALSRRIRYVAKWGPDDGFIGDGRVARFQADRLM